VLLVVDNHASRQALKMACAFLQPKDELQLVTVVMEEASRAYGERLLDSYSIDPLSSGTVARSVVRPYGGGGLPMLWY